MLRESLLDEIRSLPVEDRKALIKFLVDTLTDSHPARTRRLMEFEGVGERLRDDTIDAKDYIRQMRDEWDDRA